jgi:hypothetical protein
MSLEPTLVELLESGVVKLRLRASDKGSLNNRHPYTGRATTARIHGPKGCRVTFFDDQQFREGENYVTIEKRVSGPVEVPLASNFVGAKDAAGERIYMGKTPEYSWIFFRRRKPEWWQKLIRDIPGGQFIFDRLARELESSNDPRVQGAVKVVKVVGAPTDENYRVDNCSSVRFGE